MIHKLIIGAPFGNYFSFPGATSTVGTFTLKARAGFMTRFWRVLTTVRYDFKQGGWMNRLGLPNPGIGSLTDCSGRILSIRGFGRDDWTRLARYAGFLNPVAVEFNLSCPNLANKEEDIIGDIGEAIWLLTNNGRPCIAKLSPIKPLPLGRTLFAFGVRTFHLCNTIPTNNWGVSGKPLLPLSLKAIGEFRNYFGDRVRLIGGGGVTSLQDVQDFIRAGANHVAIASMLFNPLNWCKVKRFSQWLSKIGGDGYENST